MTATLPNDATFENVEELLLVAQFESNIPIGSGLGSSAAVSVALARCFPSNNYFQFAKRIDDYFHDGSSGIDVFTILNGGLCKLQNGNFEKLSQAHFDHINQFTFSILDTKQVREMKHVRNRITEDSKREYLAIIEPIVNEFTQALEQFNLSLELLVSLFNRTQNALTQLGVSTPQIDSFIHSIASLPIGAKITGAGGGGCLLLVHAHDFNFSLLNYPQEWTLYESIKFIP